MDWPLPCDVTVGHGTMRKGVTLRTLVNRMKTLYEMATGNDADVVANRTPEERRVLADNFLAAIHDKRPLHEQIAEVRRRERPSAELLSTMVGSAAPGAAIAAREQPTDAQIMALWRECSIPTDENNHTTGPLPFARALLKAASRQEAPAASTGHLTREWDRALGNTRSPATVAQPVTDEQIRRLFVAHGHLYAGWLELGRSILALRSPSDAAQPCPSQGCGGDGGEATQALIEWVASRWHAEVANRPLVNVHRRSLDDSWRQILRHLGVDDRARLGPTHDELAAHSSGKGDGGGS